MIRNKPKRTTSASGGLGRLQLVLESGAGRNVSEDVRPLRGEIVRSHISWRIEQNTSFKGVEISP